MADLVLLFGGQFGSGFSQFRHQKNGIVTKAICSFGTVRDYTFDLPLNTTIISGWLRNGNDASETGGTLL
jgi:hypothetical protein